MPAAAPASSPVEPGTARSRASATSTAKRPNSRSAQARPTATRWRAAQSRRSSPPVRPTRTGSRAPRPASRGARASHPCVSRPRPRRSRRRRRPSPGAGRRRARAAHPAPPPGCPDPGRRRRAAAGRQLVFEAQQREHDVGRERHHRQPGADCGGQVHRGRRPQNGGGQPGATIRAARPRVASPRRMQTWPIT